MTTIRSGRAIALFAFDIGYEISLDSLTELVPAVPIERLSGKRQTPSYLQYTSTPQVVGLYPLEVLQGRQASVRAIAFDFGAVSVSYIFDLAPDGVGLPLLDLPRVSRDLYARNLETDARARVKELMSRVEPAIDRPQLSPLVEDYYMFVIEELDEPMPAARLLQEYGHALAQTLRFDVRPLSRSLVDEALSQTISYYEDDLVIADWNTAIVYDRDYWDTVNVLGLLNVELLEARYMDAQLDERIRGYARQSKAPAEFPIPLRVPYRGAVEELAALRVDFTLLSERVDNALKLIGDLYLARVHAVASRKLHLQEWESSISRKLGILGDLYGLLSDRSRTAQAQTLEIIIILLILFEVVWALAGQ